MQKHTKHRLLVGLGMTLIASLVGARLYLNVWLPDYVNHVLDDMNGYHGSVADIDIALYRGAYRIHQLKVVKKQGNIPVPFIDIETVDLSIQWVALFHGRIVSNVELVKPVINFARNHAGTVTQNGAGVDWTKPIQELMPIDINLVTFREGKLTYQDFFTHPKVNLYIVHMHGEARNLRNVVDTEKTLPSHLHINGRSIGKGNLALNGRMNILRRIPDMDLEMKLEKVDLPALSNYTKAFAGFDIEKGSLNIYSELIVKNDHVSGYIKPLATDIFIVDLRNDSNPIELVWESLVSVVVEIFTNQPKDQFATKVPLEGNLEQVDTDTWTALGGIIRNAFFHAFSHGIDRDIKFETAPGK